MARYSENISHEPLTWAPEVNTAADHWRQSCFFDDQSMFWGDNLWTLENLVELQPRINDLQEEKGKGYIGKLVEQLDGLSKPAVRLDAEIHWVLYLILLGKSIPEYKASITPEKRRENITAILNVAGDSLPNVEWLENTPMSGLTANKRFLPTLFYQHITLIDFLVSWKRLPQRDRDAYRSRGAAWNFATWCDESHKDMNTSLRNALLYLLYPDSFEDIMSQDHKESIVKRHYGKASMLSQQSFAKAGKFSNKADVETAIFEIRQQMETELGRRVDFYSDVLNDGAKYPGRYPVADSEINDAIWNLDDPAISYEELDKKKKSKMELSEGERKLYSHYHRERSSYLRPQVIAATIKKYGRLKCDCCCTCGDLYEGSCRERVFEVHHEIPLADYDGKRITDLAEVALLCANCHRAIHATNPLKTVAELKASLIR